LGAVPVNACRHFLLQRECNYLQQNLPRRAGAVTILFPVNFPSRTAPVTLNHRLQQARQRNGASNFACLQ
jgi:hypothetical protein